AIDLTFRGVDGMHTLNEGIEVHSVQECVDAWSDLRSQRCYESTGEATGCTRAGHVRDRCPAAPGEDLRQVLRAAFQPGHALGVRTLLRGEDGCAATGAEDRVIDIGEDRDRRRGDGLWNPGKVEGSDVGQRSPGGEELLAGRMPEHGAERGDRPAA